MATPPGKFPDDVSIAARVAAGDEKAIEELYLNLEGKLKASMLSRGGAKHAQHAVDAVEEVLGECSAPYISKRGKRCQPRLANYRGEAPLGAMLHRFCRNRMIEKIRSEKNTIPVNATGEADESDDQRSITLPSSDEDRKENDLARVVADCLQEALGEANVEGIVLMRLAFLYRIPQKDLARIWQLNPGRITRRIQKTLKEIEEHTIEILAKYEPGIELTFEDIVAMGEDVDSTLWDDIPLPGSDDGENATSSN